jgi:hypothetical protein
VPPPKFHGTRDNLYDHGWDDSRWGWEINAYRVTRVTPRRVYFDSSLHDKRQYIHFVDRQKLEQDGEIWHHQTRTRLYTEMPTVRTFRDQIHSRSDLNPHKRVPPSEADVSALRKAMADTHPDRGGDREQFEAARASYLAAKVGQVTR